MWGPYREKASRESSYFLTIVDDFSGGVCVYFLIDKTDVRSYIIQFFALVKINLLKPLKASAQIMALIFLALNLFFLQNGILHQTFVTYTPKKMVVRKGNTVTF